MKKLKAFTLIEVLVAMAVSGIVITASYFAFSTVTAQMSRYRNSTGDIMDVVLFQSLLERDIRSSEYMKQTAADEMELGTGPRTIARYRLNNDYVLRIQGERYDTLKVKIGSVQFSFNNRNSEIGSFVDRIHLELNMPDTIWSVRINKEYGADVLLGFHSEHQNNGN